MGRPRKSALFPIALSLTEACEQLKCRRKTLVDAIMAGQLNIYQDPTSRRQRVLVTELCEYVRNYWPRAVIAAHRRKS